MELATRDPKQWGPPFWIMIETIASAFPDGATEPLIATTKTFFDTLRIMLPCNECRKHYTEYCVATPIDLSSQKALLDWIAKLKISMSPPAPKLPTPAPVPISTRVIIHPPPARRNTTVVQPIIKRAPNYQITMHTNKVKANTVAAATKKGCNCGGKK